ncbi:MAG TPA: O-antigen ligase family protein, partial [Bryobacteraceae bacterium]|nr:O-antigen ligase family protein [Bryobacteraceae bacterium]
MGFKLAFGLFVVNLFLAVSRLPEIIWLAGGPLIPYLIVTIQVVTLMLALISGGAWRAVGSRVGIRLGLFTGWMMACTIASTWKGGSADTLLRQWVPSLIIFVSFGSVVTLLQCQRVSTTLAAGTALIAGSSYALGTVRQDRLAFAGGTLGNSNELSMLLVLGVPFVLMPMFSQSSSRARKIIALALAAVMLVVVIKSASRSSLLALISILLVLFWTRPFAGKIKLALLGVVLLFVFLAATPREILSRYLTIFGDAASSDDIATSAQESSAARQFLLDQSLKLTMQHPIFGLGPGVFAVGEADLSKEEGRTASWHVSHNSYTQVSSEMGIPGLLFYLVALWATFRNIFWFRAHSHIDPTGRASAMGLALLLSLIGLCVNLAFSSDAYSSYLPMLMGMSIVFRKSL